MPIRSWHIFCVPAAIIALIGVCLALDVYWDNDAPICVAVIGSGAIVFAFCIVLSQRSGASWIAEPTHIQATIAASILVQYMALVGLAAFYHGSQQMPPITQALIANFTTVVGVVVASYFGSYAYLKGQEQKASRSAKAKAEAAPGNALKS
ncbi:MAG: hypothetical protein JO128_04730 [Alphaproteobacteria bacterium]|nr:hypothetical protein [Alphaproteobacteria bacterium]